MNTAQSHIFEYLIILFFYLGYYILYYSFILCIYHRFLCLPKIEKNIKHGGAIKQTIFLVQYFN